MARTVIPGSQIRNGSVQREDLDTTTPGQAVIARLLPGSGVSLISTGANPGTGDVTVTIIGPFPASSLGSGSPSAANFLRGDSTFSNALENTLVLGAVTPGAIGIEMGNTNGAATTPYFDFHSSGLATDYDVRFLISGGGGGSGQGSLTLLLAALSIAGDVSINGNLTTNNGKTVWHTGNLAPGVSIPVKNVSANYTVLLTDAVLFVDASAGAVTLTLPAAASAVTGTQGQRIKIKKIDTSVNAVTVSVAGGGLIDGAAQATITTPYNAFEFIPVPGTANWGGF